jgi:uncharacterized protein (DUF849 family)
MPALLEVALNGSRPSSDHPAIPRTPKELASASLASVQAGARALHLHAYDESGVETFEAVPCAAAIRAVRQACPGVPVSLTTSEAIEPDPDRRLELVSRWTELPDLVTANQGESGIQELCQHLVERGVGIEAGILELSDAEAFTRSGLASACERAMIEPLDPDPGTAVADAASMEKVLVDAGITLEQVHHGDGVASWAVNERAVARGHGIRTGLEDTVLMPDGRLAPDNAALVRVAAKMLSR